MATPVDAEVPHSAATRLEAIRVNLVAIPIIFCAFLPASDPIATFIDCVAYTLGILGDCCANLIVCLGLAD